MRHRNKRQPDALPHFSLGLKRKQGKVERIFCQLLDSAEARTCSLAHGCYISTELLYWGTGSTDHALHAVIPVRPCLKKN